ncbi:hypothetical protein PVK06_019690 [Gossypium arboreum]|uniref:Uncharacterized protein n=1 Tax=Gossypium arboreum TaxID=29729 RepID=A0ABR0PKE0_GOSAR|nr:hypothetical protein PVK06_019690 [Gossypium arboreum]
MFINLEKPLVSQVLVDGAIKKVEYEALPTICFGCGKYRHVKDLCPTVAKDRSSERLIEVVNVDSISVVGGAIEGTESEFGPWMLVERKSRRGQRSVRGNVEAKNDAKSRKKMLGHRFSALKEEVSLDVENHGGLSIEIQRDLNAGNRANIKANFNPAFQGSGGIIISIYDGVLYPGKHSTIIFKDNCDKKENSSSVNLA